MVQIRSEVGRLRSALVHAPGAEIDRMVPSMMEDLLFDDILFGDGARAEHASFRRVLEKLGVVCLEVQDLVAAILRNEEARNRLLAALGETAGGLQVDRMREESPETLASLLVGGLRMRPDTAAFDRDELFEIPPVPNLCFQRDPQMIIGDGVIFSSMATPARWREALLARAVFRFHPDFSSVPVILDPIQRREDRPLLLGLRRPSFEGGDLLVLSPEVVAVGYSERTNRTGVREVARALAATPDGPRWLLVVSLPPQRAYMHLDTLVTPVDRDACLLHAPVMQPGGAEEAEVYEFDLRAADLQPAARKGFLAALERRNVVLEPIPCGGSDPLSQQREQWTDGANSLALAPGVITLYDRNPVTAEELSRHGFRIFTVDDVLAGRAGIDLDAPERACILIPSHELSRARGGPHCLAHPLVRED